ncbi:DUF927 domain-containing protein [Hyphomicrobium sp. CS1BSMeth3]|uniref:DUF927 domain-containing protein n=1 Tax=Hyphomicrobium sp. CS1BSMeth3 TaxID=1892844 RepID=UPI0009315EBE|nr:DUF927 domain-containing protein [Hyphomicrobium sp. CS1BSMeth3]
MTNLHVLSDAATRRAGKQPKKPASKLRDGAIRYAADGSLEMQDEDAWRDICSPIKLKGVFRDNHSLNWGRRVSVQDPDGRWNEALLPAEWLIGDGNRGLEIIANRGGRIKPGKECRAGVLRYLNRITDLDSSRLPRVIIAQRTGWHGDSFVLPDRVIGGIEDVCYQPRSISAAVAQRGSLEDWQRKVAAPARSNSRLVLSLSLAFAAPLLGRLGYSEGFIVHFRGGSSTGKTTALEVAGSVWGGGDIGGYSQSWHATSNGIEAIAEAHCDLLICLDELGQCRADDAGRVAYQLAAGMGRGRALVDGNGATRKRWRTLGLSTGELSLEDKLREGRTGQRIMAGQAVRFIDLAADAEKGFGLFDHAPEIRGNPDATVRERGRALADRLKDAVQVNYGTAGPAFLEAVIADLEDALINVRSDIEAIIARMAPPVADGQVQRVARHFALIGAAGELATMHGILPWPRGEASQAAEVCFRDWLASRGTAGASEIEDAINHLRAVIERDGASRFQKDSSPSDAVRDRLGFTKPDVNTGDVLYLFQAEAWKSIMAGRDPGRIARELVGRRIIRPGENGRTQRKERLSGHPPQRFYVISHTALFADHGDDVGDGT